ncbi:Dyp-type peroxidase [Bombilactobacillus thymidiniphilus]|uniref:Dyp-type peroxidase n=1 Tax=Bombilactobacillus thymidiniphilus TaxID=2923363 RepID=A0ABY4PEX7_9LACO|nr:Dyp-type peroxidase [Bombilactobacillus thymidiniphilus]UQS84076.1 Dyp-type peroxidase [Bombilactobacillus thymidiniphilus]
MEINPLQAQDVWKDVGENIIFTTLLLNRTDQQQAQELIQEFADRANAIKNSMRIRYPEDELRVAIGFGAQAWSYLFPKASVPKELVTFSEIKGPKYTAVATPGDLFLHVRAHKMAVCYEVVEQLSHFLRNFTTVVDETHGFRYFEGRAIIGFIDGTENPANEDTASYALIGSEDPEFINGSYAFAQKYRHNMQAWNDLDTTDQEKAIGRKKFSDLELVDEQKDSNAHNIVSQDNDDGVEHKIVRMNVPYSDPATGITGTYFIGYSRYFSVTHRMLVNMFSQNDRLLDFSTPLTGSMYFIPSRSLLARIAAGELC